jgi:deoxyribonuclease-4
MKFGLKLWSTNTDLIHQAVKLIDEKIFDYIELFVVPDTLISPFLIDVPYVIHIPHHKFGVNIGESNIKKYNLEKINESISWADELEARYLILHAGHGSMDDATELLNEITDVRLIIENMPKVGLDGEMMIGYSPEQITKLIDVNDFGSCLDFGHAIKAAVSLNLDYKEFVKGFLRCKPRVFHISDGGLGIEKDEHLNIGEGQYDFEYLIKSIEKKTNGIITLETPRNDHKSLNEDVRNIDKLKKISGL